MTKSVLSVKLNEEQEWVKIFDSMAIRYYEMNSYARNYTYLGMFGTIAGAIGMVFPSGRTASAMVMCTGVNILNNNNTTISGLNLVDDVLRIVINDEEAGYSVTETKK
jgi:hypothetical protein